VQDFPHLFRPSTRPTQPSVLMGTGSLSQGHSIQGVELTIHPI